MTAPDRPDVRARLDAAEHRRREHALRPPPAAAPAPLIGSDPRYAFGQPTLTRTGVRVDDVVGMFRGGESLEVVADEYGLTTAEVEACLRYRLPSVDER